MRPWSGRGLGLFTLPLIASVGVAQEKPPAKCTLSGIVVDFVTGEALNKVQILAEPIGGRGLRISTTTDANGDFTLSMAAPAQYRLKGQRNGYLDTYFGSRRGDGKGHVITVEAGQKITDLKFKLIPFGVIAGTIRESDGEPLAGAAVTLYRLKFTNGRRVLSGVETKYTDDIGQYRIANLPAGRYYVLAEAAAVEVADYSGRSPEVLVPSTYPNGQDLSSARALEVSSGARLLGIDITLPRSRGVQVKGHVISPPGTTLGTIDLRYGRGLRDEPGWRLETRPNTKGDFVFQAVPPGSYTLIATAKLPLKPTNRLFDLFNQSQYKAYMAVQVGSSSVEDLRVAIDAGAEVSGIVSLEEENDTKLGKGAIRFDDGIESIHVMISDDGKFTTALSPGHYAIYTYFSNLIVKSVRLRDKEILNDGLSITEPGQLPLEIVLTADAGQLTGLVVNKEKNPIAGAIVVLVPVVRLPLRADLFRQIETDQHGQFRMDTLTPGDYRLFAWEDLEEGIWYDPDFLKRYENRGEPVKIHPKRIETAEIQVIATEQ